MSVPGLRSIAGAIGGCVVGFIAVFILFIPACFIVGVAHPNSTLTSVENITENVLSPVPFVGAAIGFLIGLAFDMSEAKERAEAERKRRETEDLAREVEERRRRVEIAWVGLREIFDAAVGGTELQRYERVKPFIGRTFELTEEIGQIDKFEVCLARSSWNTHSIKIHYSAENLASELLKYSSGDRVRLSLKLTSVLIATSSTFYDFHLVKIEKASSATAP